MGLPCTSRPPTAEPRGGRMASEQEPMLLDPCPRTNVRAWQEGTRRGRAPPAAPATVPSAWHWPGGARAEVGLGISIPNSQGLYLQSTHTCTLTYIHSCMYAHAPTCMHTCNTRTRTFAGMCALITCMCVHMPIAAHAHSQGCTLSHTPFLHGGASHEVKGPGGKGVSGRGWHPG